MSREGDNSNTTWPDWTWEKPQPHPDPNARAGCYLCRPDDPNAEDEACAQCDFEFWKNPVAIYIGDADD